MLIPHAAFCWAGLICLGSGIVLTAGAGMFPNYEAVLERWGGNIFAGGLVLAGLGFPFL